MTFMPVIQDKICVENISAEVSLGAPFQVDVAGQGVSTQTVTTNSDTIRSWEAIVPDDVILTLQGIPTNLLPQVEYKVPLVKEPVSIGLGQQFFTEVLQVGPDVMRNFNLFPLDPSSAIISVHFYMLPSGEDSTPVKGIVTCTVEAISGDVCEFPSSSLNWQTGAMRLCLPHPLAPNTDIKLGYFPVTSDQHLMQEFLLPSVPVSGETHFTWQADSPLDLAYGSVELHAISITGKHMVVRSTRDGKLEGDIDTTGVNRVNYTSCSVDVTFAEIVGFHLPVTMHYATYQTAERFTKYDAQTVPVTVKIPWKDLNRIHVAGIRTVELREHNHKYGDR
jgi:hypothetical protein